MTIDPVQLAPWISLVVAVGGAAAVLYRAARKIELVARDAERQKDDTAMLLEASQACLDGLVQLKCNGKVTEVRGKLIAHLIKNR